MTINFLSDKFPTRDVTDGQYLYLSLGSFWNYIFNDKNALKGYTTGMAEELIQSYYRLTEVVQQYSIKDTPILRKEKWKPLVIKKSEFNRAPFVFDDDGAVFGYQPDTDKYYANKIFRFGFPKETTDKLYSFAPPFPLKKFGLIANRVIAPSFVMIPGVDVLYDNNVLYFNDNLFDNQYIPRGRVVEEFGVSKTFVDSEGRTIDDEFIILWVYNSEEDKEDLHSNFGTLLDLYLPTSESYKQILSALFNLLVDGPNIRALNIVFAAFNKTPIILENKETIEEIYTLDNIQYVISDKNVYKLPSDQELASYVKPGAVLDSGRVISNNIKVIDAVINPAWWQHEIQTNKLAFSSHVFAANTKSQLFFENSVKLVTYINGVLTFPVVGRDNDVEAFQQYINEPDRKAEIVKIFGQKLEDNFSLAINPVDFVFKNIFKNNTLLLKLNFNTDIELSQFFELLPNIQQHLPSHVYILIYLTLRLPPDNIDNLNHGLTIPEFGSQAFSLDGSLPLTGARPQLPGGTDLNYYKDYINRLFCVSVGPYRNGYPLHHETNLDQVYLNGDSNSVRVIEGSLRTEIPETIQPIGEDYPRTPSTREIPTVLLIDF
jgi:hypothetical protein